MAEYKLKKGDVVERINSDFSDFKVGMKGDVIEDQDGGNVQVRIRGAKKDYTYMSENLRLISRGEESKPTGLLSSTSSSVFYDEYTKLQDHIIDSLPYYGGVSSKWINELSTNTINKISSWPYTSTDEQKDKTMNLKKLTPQQKKALSADDQTLVESRILNDDLTVNDNDDLIYDFIVETQKEALASWIRTRVAEQKAEERSTKTVPFSS